MEDGKSVRMIDVQEAMALFPWLLDEVVEGTKIAITKDGVPVTSLESVSEPDRISTREAIEAICGFQKGKKLGDMSVRDLIDEERRY